MKYSQLVEIYESLEATSKRLEKTYYIAKLLGETDRDMLPKIVLLLQGKIYPSWDERKIGVASRLVIKALGLAVGLEADKIESEWKKTGDLGKVAEALVGRKKQATLSSMDITVQKVFSNLRKLAELEGQGTVQKTRQFYGERGERFYSIQNCAAAAQNMLLAAHAQDLGSCWVGSFDEDMLRKTCGIPEYIRPQAVIALGYAAETPESQDKYRLYDIVHIEGWDAKIKDPKWVLKEHAWSVENKLKRQAKKMQKRIGKWEGASKDIFDKLRSKKE